MNCLVSFCSCALSNSGILLVRKILRGSSVQDLAGIVSNESVDFCAEVKMGGTGSASVAYVLVSLIHQRCSPLMNFPAFHPLFLFSVYCSTRSNYFALNATTRLRILSVGILRHLHMRTPTSNFFGRLLAGTFTPLSINSVEDGHYSLSQLQRFQCIGHSLSKIGKNQR